MTEGASRAFRLRLDDVSRRIGGRAILEGVRLEARPGELIAVVGKSGCGKTTLLRLIAGLDRPSTGEIRLGERGGVRMVFQEPRLLPWRRVIDNVLLGQPKGAAHLEDGLDVLARVGLSGRAHDWPAVLSGGERQRVALARALVSRPGLLLLDEPLGALDAFTRVEMQTLLENIWSERGFTAVLVTHDVQEAVALADRVITLAAGRVASSVEIDLPRPRDRFHTAFTARVAEVLDHLAAGHRAAGPRPAAPTLKCLA
ncbi:MAG TPA: ABC transporter ATP-binding protein [Polyangia bacterium]|nr:ABC transporter ATP-binding protein [Polyangia bacterium]